MKKILLLGSLLFAFLFLFENELCAQTDRERTRTEDYFDERGGFAHRLWYGGGFTLGFAGNQFESLFQLGISPMMGYKIFEQLSVGPRVSLTYSYYKVNYGGGRVEKAQPLNWSVGAFARYKIIPIIFAHVEYEYENAAVFVYNPNLEVLRRNRDNTYIGAGYNSGNGLWGYEILLLYNLNTPENSIELPINLRFGITYNF
jgi:hypothetical protein